MRTVILDCDIASCLAKINRIDLLGAAFPDFEVYITESVSIELLRASQTGFSFPDRIFKSIPVISLNQDERIMLQEIPRNRSIHFGEAEGLIISKNRNTIFLTNDSRAVRYCRDNDIKVLDLRDLLLILFKRRALTREEIKYLIRDIEDRDNIIIKYKSELLSLMSNHIGEDGCEGGDKA
jgi:predicted nucleic acid-binding protein